MKNDRYRRQSAENGDGKKRRTASEQARRGLAHYLPTTDPPSLEVVTAIGSLNSSSSAPREREALREVTFAERRRLIVHCRLPLSRLREKFGWLFAATEIWEEYLRISGKAETEQADASCRLRGVVSSLKGRMGEGITEDGTIEALVDLLGSDLSALVGDSAEQPKLIRDADRDGTSYKLIVEEETVGAAPDLASGVLLWTVAHIVFAQSVRRNSRRPLYLFMQHFVLNVSESSVLPRACWRAAKALGVGGGEVLGLSTGLPSSRRVLP